MLSTKGLEDLKLAWCCPTDLGGLGCLAVLKGLRRSRGWPGVAKRFRGPTLWQRYPKGLEVSAGLKSVTQGLEGLSNLGISQGFEVSAASHCPRFRGLCVTWHFFTKKFKSIFGLTLPKGLRSRLSAAITQGFEVSDGLTLPKGLGVSASSQRYPRVWGSWLRPALLPQVPEGL